LAQTHQQNEQLNNSASAFKLLLDLTNCYHGTAAATAAVAATTQTTAFFL